MRLSLFLMMNNGAKLRKKKSKKSQIVLLKISLIFGSQLLIAGIFFVRSAKLPNLKHKTGVPQAIDSKHTCEKDSGNKDIEIIRLEIE